MAHPATQHLLDLFEYEHLRSAELRSVSARFSELAHDLARDLGDNGEHGPELTVALRKLLESKDAAVRHAVINLRRGGATE